MRNNIRRAVNKTERVLFSAVGHYRARHRRRQLALALCCLKRVILVLMAAASAVLNGWQRKKKSSTSLEGITSDREPYFSSSASGLTAALLRSGFTVSATKKYLVLPCPASLERLWLWLLPCISFDLAAPLLMVDFLPRAAMKVVLRPRTGIKPMEVRSLGGLNQWIQRSQLNRLSRRGSSSALAFFCTSCCPLQPSSLETSAGICSNFDALLAGIPLRSFVLSSSLSNRCTRWLICQSKSGCCNSEMGEKNWK